MKLEDQNYKPVIQSLLKSKEFLPGALRSKDEKVAGPIVKLIEKTKGFEDAGKRRQQDRRSQEESCRH